MDEKQMIRLAYHLLYVISAVLIAYWSGLFSGSPKLKLWLMMAGISMINMVAGVWAGFLRGWEACEGLQQTGESNSEPVWRLNGSKQNRPTGA
jgi:hypothetical protein